MKKYGSLLLCGSFLFLLWCTSGCSTTYGRLVPNSQFAYPNSNIKTLGPVKAEVQKTTWLIAPTLKSKDIKKCYNDALSQASGANILINYKEDTTFTAWPFSIYNIKYRIEGEAGRMVIGKQELR